MRLQCYEGLDEAKALYEWNYRKQLLRIQAEADGTGWDAVQDDIFGEEFLLSRPLMQAIAAEEPVVLLIDEIDKTDQEFEAMLLELLSDFQITIPELGRIEARTHPVVLLTSNNTRELTEALKRRCLYLWLDYPDTEHELEIVRMHAPELARDGRAQARRPHPPGARARPQEAALDRRVDRLGARAAAARRRRHRPTCSATRCRSSSSTAPTSTRWPSASGSAWPRELRRADPPVRRGAARGGGGDRHLRAQRHVRGARRGAVDGARRLPRRARLHAGQVARGPADLRPRVRALLLPRRRGSRRCATRSARATEDGITGGERIELDNLREQLLQAIRDGDEAAMRDLARLAIAAFGRRGEGSGVLGVDVQRIRRALGPALGARRAGAGRSRTSSCR